MNLDIIQICNYFANDQFANLVFLDPVSSHHLSVLFVGILLNYHLKKILIIYEFKSHSFHYSWIIFYFALEFTSDSSLLREIVPLLPAFSYLE